MIHNEPITKSGEPIYLNDAQGRTHILTGIQHTQIVCKGNLSGKLRKQLSRYYVDNGIAYRRINYYINDNDQFCITWERLLKLNN